jgi:hypothetical protein
MLDADKGPHTESHRFEEITAIRRPASPLSDGQGMEQDG